jgi:hypothetical protein
VILAGQIGNRAGQLDDAVVGVVTELHLATPLTSQFS